ncbi:MAG: glucose-6-phosphate dehydrogenase (coenzyme-F420) [Candidatus Dormibacteraeota bacterium]|uniref:Glucose-6-phosphate dehydrogenase (Coenzyme-F420) n=1 Tax=Candidatus Dormiibacter inghamiae TaxID=3127013 RepID=A0A934NDS3_9BACT|nr:glucose-6-phosphate dehydrogenase (coenzyme-F420) [Candidatus Dormibacteraeota bacterium]MBJ7606714.1 glucose-6-phosphate dehydrogenase (coenzyme-F420) [Candidatus Dormibacteraeota bacterium]
MSHQLKIGWKASAEQFGPRQLLDYAVLAEELGYDSVWVSDHYQPWRHTNGHAPFSLAWLGALAVSTQRIEMGTSVLTPTFRYHPSIIAQAFATLGVLAPGRVILGVGTGESMNEVPVIGIEWPEFRERFRRLSEATKLIRKLWSEDFVEFEGEYYRVRGATVYDRPQEMVKIYVGASGEVAARFAGRQADGFICTSGKGPELYSQKLLPAVAEGARAAGRDFEAIEKTIELKVSFDSDRQRALADTRIWAALALPAEDKANVHNPREMEKLAAKVEHPEKRWLVAADPDEHVEQLRPYLELGFTHLIFHAPGDDQAGFLKLFSEQVIPRLRARWG